MQKFFSRDFYPLTEYSTQSDRWMAWQFDAPESSQGMIQAFRRAANSNASMTFKLRGLDPKANYLVKNMDLPGSHIASGTSLMGAGLEVSIPRAPCSALITYEKSEK